VKMNANREEKNIFGVIEKLTVVGGTAHLIQCIKKACALQIMVMEMASMLLWETAKGTFHVVEAVQLFSLVNKLFILITYSSHVHLRKMLGALGSDKSADDLVDKLDDKSEDKSNLYLQFDTKD